MAGTLTPTPYQTVLDGDGVAVSGAKVYTYEAGTTTNATTYTTSALSEANANPIVADSAGRYVAYLSAGANLRFIIKTSADVTIDDQDNVQAVPGTSVNLDIEGTVGEAVTAGQVLYLSSAAESSPLTAGKWYLTDSDAAATSTTPQSIGVAVSAIAINTAGTIRLAGEVDSASSVVVGTTYYIGATPGAIVSSAPALSRQVGVAITTSSLLLAATTAVVGALPNPITQDLLFTDATYDIGKSGASRPRDVFASRNAAVGGTLGVSGISTFTADLVATGASMSFQDDEGITLGTGDDATVKYDGTDLVIAPAAVGAGDVHVSGGSVEVDDSESFTLGTGKDATIIYDGTDLTISPAAVGSGDLVIAGASAEFADDEGVTLGTGKDATLQYDGTNVSLDTQAVGSGLLIVTGSSAISGVEIDNTATDGDPTLAFTLSGTSLFTMGVDDGDSDLFKIGTTAIGTNTALTIDGSQDVYTTAWTDYYSSSTIVGWSSLTAGRRRIMYKTIGKLVFVFFHLEGTSNATTVSFTLPYTSTAVGFGNLFYQLLTFTYDNTLASTTPGKCGVDVNSATATCSKTSAASGGWTASGSKIVSGQFIYEMA